MACSVIRRPQRALAKQTGSSTSLHIICVDCYFVPWRSYCVDLLRQGDAPVWRCSVQELWWM
ncbi:hypothetical protein K438DRAFT_1832419 [Mycena galopus ATCC 62051]|nr:hypothetical protein K438DRAFT_1832419 [Mycena galopus ATCC 62051]